MKKKNKVKRNLLMLYIALVLFKSRRAFQYDVKVYDMQQLPGKTFMDFVSSSYVHKRDEHKSILLTHRL